MNDRFDQFFMFLKSMPLSRKISIVFTVALLIAGFAVLFVLANRVDYQVLYSDLSQKDAGAITEELKKKNIVYKVEGNGTRILVPSNKVYDLRLSLVSQGLPKEGQVGFEIFDNTDFKTTRFVQELNYRRALQGELARTISRFDEVSAAKVFIVLSKESLFVEEEKPASASIQLDLKSSLPPGRLAAIIHLVAGAVEGLEPEQVTVVDTKGRVIFKGGNQNASGGLLSGMQLDYRQKIEIDIKNNVQTMLEGIVGPGKAIVRVTAEVDFNKITLNEEEYDPDSVVVRSKRDSEETSQAGKANAQAEQAAVNERAGVVPGEGGAYNGKSKKDIVTNYEINKVTRAIFKPAGSIKRLSVAAVIDGSYETTTSEDGSVNKKFIPRTEDELVQFEAIVKSAMGYNEDREDQISVSSIPFSGTPTFDDLPEADSGKFDIMQILRDYRKVMINSLLMVLIFFILIRPLLKSLKKMTSETTFETRDMVSVSDDARQISPPAGGDRKERVIEITRNNPERTEQLIKGWIGE